MTDFKKIYEDLLETDNVEEAVNELTTANLKGYCYYLLDKETLSDEEKQALSDIILICLYIYNNSPIESPISDELYDSLYELNRDVNYIEIVGSVNPAGRTIVSHNYPDLRGTLDKIHFFREEDRAKSNEKHKKSMEYWFNQVFTKVNRDSKYPLKKDTELKLMIMPKYDGVSVIIETDENFKTDKALTRGDTEKNEAVDLTNIFKNISFKYLAEKYGITSKMGIKFECYMTYENYKAYCKKYGKFNNPRSAATSALKESNGDEVLSYLTLQPLRIQTEDKKIIVIEDDCEYISCNVLDDYIRLIEIKSDIIIDKMKEKNIPIDGIVVVILNDEIRDIMGRKDAINKYEFAYKFPTTRYRTKILDVEWSVGALGNITPVAKIEPIICNGNTVDSPTLSNLDKFRSLNLAPGDEVVIIYDIVPYLLVDSSCSKSGKPKFEVPKKCPICKHDTISSGAFLTCSNDNCPSKAIGKLTNYVAKMRIPYISTETITRLFNDNILMSIEDLYRLKNYRGRIVNIDGFGEKSYQNIIDGIDSRRKVSISDLIGSLGIKSIGRTKMKSILDIYNLEELLEICENYDFQKLEEIKGVAHPTAEKIVYGIMENKNLIRFLQKELTITDAKPVEVVCFTGFRDKEFKKFLENKGIKVNDSFTNDVTLLIVDDIQKEETLPKESQSKKYRKALDKGIKVMGADEYAEREGYGGHFKFKERK